VAHAHFLGICGYAVSGLALVAKEMGYTVTGSDEDAYPPTTDTLTAAGIPWRNAHEAENLKRWGTPDVVIQGNQVRADNVEAQAARRMGLRVTSEPEFYYELTQERLRIAVCGTHGKTTTASLIAWILEDAGRKPGYRLGITAKNFDRSAAMGTGPEFVFEGDEYTTSAEDPRPKFYHFHPEIAVLTNVELDHPDVYPDLPSYRAAFELLPRHLPASGLLVACADDTLAMEIAGQAVCPVQTYGIASSVADWRAEGIEFDAESTRFQVVRAGSPWLAAHTELAGRHNVLNTLAAVAVAAHLGLAPEQIGQGVRTFHGASRRFELVGEAAGVAVIDDYAHHPSEVRATIAAARARYPQARVIAIYVPHTYSRTHALLDAYGDAFAGAELALIGPIEPARERHLAHTVSAGEVAARAQTHTRAEVVDSAKAAAARAAATARPGDVVLCMSVRGFDRVALKVVAALRERG
jgi:UDP-N-acetylmuramate: L-alanyl-gamma-D-glutamyl-meso-diaminopimelate ligase